MFDHDKFINKPCQNIFGREIQYIPGQSEKQPFQITGDFHEAYTEINLKNINSSEVSSEEIVLFVRMVDFPPEYMTILQGDFVVIKSKKYQIINIQPHIPGSKKLILHEDSE